MKYMQTGKLKSLNLVDKDTKPRGFDAQEISAQSIGIGSNSILARRSKLKSEIGGGKSHKSNTSIFANNINKQQSAHSGKKTASVLSQRRQSTSGPNQDSIENAGVVINMLDNCDEIISGSPTKQHLN